MPHDLVILYVVFVEHVRCLISVVFVEYFFSSCASNANITTGCLCTFLSISIIFLQFLCSNKATLEVCELFSCKLIPLSLLTTFLLCIADKCMKYLTSFDYQFMWLSQIELVNLRYVQSQALFESMCIFQTCKWIVSIDLACLKFMF